MDVLGFVHTHHPKKSPSSSRSSSSELSARSKARKRSSRGDKAAAAAAAAGDAGVKVVYISSPMKVKTSAAEFRSIVQGLTGRDSDVTRFHMEQHPHHQACHAAVDERGFRAVGEMEYSMEDAYGTGGSAFAHRRNDSIYSDWDSPTESDSAVEEHHVASTTVTGGGWGGGMIFPAEFYQDPASNLMLDVLNCFENPTATT